MFDLPPGVAPDDVIGRILPVHVTGAGPLLLEGELATVVEERTPATQGAR